MTAEPVLDCYSPPAALALQTAAFLTWEEAPCLLHWFPWLCGINVLKEEFEKQPQRKQTDPVGGGRHASLCWGDAAAAEQPGAPEQGKARDGDHHQPRAWHQICSLSGGKACHKASGWWWLGRWIIPKLPNIHPREGISVAITQRWIALKHCVNRQLGTAKQRVTFWKEWKVATEAKLSLQISRAKCACTVSLNSSGFGKICNT